MANTTIPNAKMAQDQMVPPVAPVFSDSSGVLSAIGNGTPLPTAGIGVPSDGSNTTTTPLAADATFTGDWETNSFSEVMVSCKTDGASTLYFDFSNDMTNVDTFPVQGFAVAANIHEFHIAVKGPRYFRLRLVNGSDAQTFLRLYTYFGTFRAANTPLNQGIGLDSDAAGTRPTDFQDEVRRGLRSGVTGWTKFGYRNSISNDTESCIWAATPALPTFLLTASTFTIAYDGTSGGSTDGAGTNGATQMYIYYIDAAGLPAIGAHTLGTDGSDVTTFSGLGINRAVVSASGSDNFNASDITITATTGGSVQAIIPAEGSVTQQAIFFTGANHTGIAPWLHIEVISSNKAKTVEVKGYVFNRQFETRYEVYRGSIDTSVNLEKDVPDPIKFQLNATDILYFTVNSSGGSGTIDADCRFSLNEYQLT